MGINTIVVLPDNVRIKDVMSVIGVAVGCKATYQEFTCGSGGYARVEGIKAKVTDSCPEMVNITFGKEQNIR